MEFASGASPVEDRPESSMPQTGWRTRGRPLARTRGKVSSDAVIQAQHMLVDEGVPENARIPCGGEHGEPTRVFSEAEEFVGTGNHPEGEGPPVEEAHSVGVGVTRSPRRTHLSRDACVKPVNVIEGKAVHIGRETDPHDSPENEPDRKAMDHSQRCGSPFTLVLREGQTPASVGSTDPRGRRA
jgi:hypothetical protein